MVRVFERARRCGNIKRRTPKTSRIFNILNIMLQRIETPDGKRWAIVLDNDCTSLEDICEMQKDLIEIMI
jgi:acetolactate synthase small subunit